MALRRHPSATPATRSGPCSSGPLMRTTRFSGRPEAAMDAPGLSAPRIGFPLGSTVRQATRGSARRGNSGTGPGRGAVEGQPRPAKSSPVNALIPAARRSWHRSTDRTAAPERRSALITVVRRSPAERRNRKEVPGSDTCTVARTVRATRVDPGCNRPRPGGSPVTSRSTPRQVPQDSWSSRLDSASTLDRGKRKRAARVGRSEARGDQEVPANRSAGSEAARRITARHQTTWAAASARSATSDPGVPRSSDPRGRMVKQVAVRSPVRPRDRRG